MTEYTLLLVKPNAFAKRRAGAILQMVEQNGFELIEVKTMVLSVTMAEDFYSIHKGKDFFNDLVSFMSSGKIIAAIIKMDDAVHQLRELVGSTNPALAHPGTIRYLYGEAINRNAVHASDSIENAREEIKIVFPEFLKSIINQGV